MVPKNISAEENTNWKEIFLAQLKVSTLEGAQELFSNMINLNQNDDYYINLAESYLDEVHTHTQDLKSIEKLIKDLIRHRKEVFESEISKNPKGQILEPGFRVIFPEKK